jgi:hypothetical protein
MASNRNWDRRNSITPAPDALYLRGEVLSLKGTSLLRKLNIALNQKEPTLL